jgi:phosphomannomutase
MPADAKLLAAAEAWLQQDPDETTRAELSALIEAGDEAELQARFGKRLQFGTAGLRGGLGAGPNRMNRVSVAQAALGIANWVKKNPEFPKPSVVIGFDGRINSDVFAKDSAAIFAGAGLEVLLFEDMVPTPVLAFATKQGGYSIGVMVTASHNPVKDNGYKVYLGGKNGGSQIISPTDTQMAAEIAKVAETLTFDEIPKSENFVTGGADLQEVYLELTSALVDPEAEHATISTIYTAMHGVGWLALSTLFEYAGLPRPAVVRSQIEPDGNFPTVAFPNPEEPGALDEAFAAAKQVRAKLILANDPDADRLAVAVANKSYRDGYRVLTGDEVGLILAAEIATAARDAGIEGTLASSVVSSSALEAVALYTGQNFVQTLTGFKWISKVPNLLFGYEEALGYCVDPQHTPDKDGISAALVIADLASRIAANGETLEDYLNQLSDIFGHYSTGQISLRYDDVSIAQDMVAELRANPPATIDGAEAAFTDLALGSDALPPTDGLRFDLADGRRVIVRPSGTEPKLKCYLQAIGADYKTAKNAKTALEAAMREILEG